MAWIRIIDVDEAEGLLAGLYEAAVKRAGRVFNVVKIQSINPPVLRRGIGLYLEAMHGDSPLTRAQREMLAVVVSAANGCYDKWVEQIARDYTKADLTEQDRALCDHAVKLTHDPGTVSHADIERLRAVDLDDRAIHDATQVIAYFNYINRIADGLGVDLEPEMQPSHG
jgi:alkylhydroperoxidase family enzyme